MFVSLNIWGAYVFWALVCAVGFILLGIWAPETKGVPMERMEELFASHWWMGWRAKVGLTQWIRADKTVDEKEGKELSAIELERV